MASRLSKKKSLWAEKICSVFSRSCEGMFWRFSHAIQLFPFGPPLTNIGGNRLGSRWLPMSDRNSEYSFKNLKNCNWWHWAFKWLVAWVSDVEECQVLCIWFQVGKGVLIDHWTWHWPWNKMNTEEELRSLANFFNEAVSLLLNGVQLNELLRMKNSSKYAHVQNKRASWVGDQMRWDVPNAAKIKGLKRRQECRLKRSHCKLWQSAHRSPMKPEMFSTCSLWLCHGFYSYFANMTSSPFQSHTKSRFLPTMENFSFLYFKKFFSSSSCILCGYSISLSSSTLAFEPSCTPTING